METALRSDGFKFEILIGKHERLISRTKQTREHRIRVFSMVSATKKNISQLKSDSHMLEFENLKEKLS